MRKQLEAEERSELGRRIEAGLREAIAFERGELPGVPVTEVPVTARDAEVDPPPEFSASEVRQIRERTGLSQTVFAKTLNASPATVRAWEQGKRTPEGPSRRLLQLAAARPQLFLDVVRMRKGQSYRAG